MSKKADWKKEIEIQLQDNFPGTKISWNGNDPTLIVPDDRANQQDEIIAFVTGLWERSGGEVKFFPEQAISVPE